jgi:hypothetical protein
VLVMKIATGKCEEKPAAKSAAVELGRKGGLKGEAPLCG